MSLCVLDLIAKRAANFLFANKSFPEKLFNQFEGKVPEMASGLLFPDAMLKARPENRESSL
ncbi:hypothetical protein GALL_30560 [mine drainage metagenome]|uniref:Uncharacterized protein n=1 Tax=mine drainage metagenome TaxID=410659 RepID=A0A1J5TW88_9ZZZZ